MGGRTDTANTLHQVLGVKGVASLEEYLETPEEGAAGFCLFNDSILDGDLDFEVAFDSGERVNYNSCHRLFLLSVLGSGVGTRPGYLEEVPSGDWHR
jgi:hypothetical protein